MGISQDLQQVFIRMGANAWDNGCQRGHSGAGGVYEQGLTPFGELTWNTGTPEHQLALKIGLLIYCFWAGRDRWFESGAR